MVVAKCESHTELALEIRETRTMLKGLSVKVDRIEKLTWALAISIGACAAALGLSPELPATVLAWLQ